MAEIDDLNVTDASNTGRFPEGQAPSTVNDGARALEGMLARAFKDTVDANLRATLSVSTYEIVTNRSISAYDGLVIAWRANAANAVGAVDLAINGQTKHDLLLPGGVEVPASYIAADNWVWCQFQGTASTWQIISPLVVSDYALTLLNDASATAARSTLGLGSHPPIPVVESKRAVLRSRPPHETVTPELGTGHSFTLYIYCRYQTPKGGHMMQSQVSKWGNSLALRVPKALAGEIRLHEGLTVDMTIKNDSLVVRPARPKYKLKDLLANETRSKNVETDWGEARGEEEW